MSYRSHHLGQVAPAGSPWVNGATFLRYLDQELARIAGSTFDTNALRQSVQAGIGPQRSILVTRTADNTVLVESNYPHAPNTPNAPIGHVFTIYGVYMPAFLRAYQRAQHRRGFFGLGQTPAASPAPAAPAAAASTVGQWVSGLVFLENVAQELNRVGGTFDTSSVQSDIGNQSLASIAAKSVKVAQTAPDTVVVTIDNPGSTSTAQSETRDTFTIVGTYAPAILMRAYTLSQAGFTLDTGLLRRRVTGIVIGFALSFWFGQWWEKQREKYREYRRRSAA